MKTNILFSMLLIAIIFVTSCKDDDEGTPRQVTESHTYSENIRGTTGVKGELPLPDLNLTDILDEEIVNNLTKAELQLADSYLEISGLNQVDSSDTVAVVLEDFTIKIGTRTGVNLGDVSTNAQGTNELASDVQHSSNQIISLIQNVFSDVTSESKRARITVSFTPNADITSTDNVQLEIHFGGIYHYTTFDFEAGVAAAGYNGDSVDLKNLIAMSGMNFIGTEKYSGPVQNTDSEGSGSVLKLPSD